MVSIREHRSTSRIMAMTALSDSGVNGSASRSVTAAYNRPTAASSPSIPPLECMFEYYRDDHPSTSENRI
ncbi:hypothetical protein [Nocardia cyriacigeorgica]|uniref:hypothetical protein n=1 Tax=Nocardia cyriacigeorgica TaxID=135487 RepID=UPI0020183D6E|nr:hypothetical protein [Nocardia cyriacigeorgica]